MKTFSSSEFLSSAVLARITEARVADPELSWRSAEQRVRRKTLAPAGTLNLVAADHPARNITSAGGNEMVMADRRDYLARVLRVLSADQVDGVMASMDILEDLLAIDGMLRARGEATFLDNRVVIASLNRGGLSGSAWELDDPATGATPAAAKAWRLDGVKVLLRVDETDPLSLRTMTYCAQAIRDANREELPTFLEPLPVIYGPHGYVATRNAQALAKLVGVASALGDSSRRLWLKLPWCEDFATVARATTLPVLLLGGEVSASPAGFLEQLAGAMRAGKNVRGTMTGRNVLYPGDWDPAVVAGAAGRIVHDGCSVDEALAATDDENGRGLRCLESAEGVSR